MPGSERITMVMKNSPESLLSFTGVQRNCKTRICQNPGHLTISKAQYLMAIAKDAMPW